MQKSSVLLKSIVFQRLVIGLLVALYAVLSAACGLLPSDSKIDEGIVNVPKLKIRSSTAPAVLVLVEVKRGDRQEILEHAQVKTPTRTHELYKVRTKSKETT